MEEQTTKSILARLKSVEGHVRGVARMVENGEYCIDIVNQIQAVQSALQKVSAIVLDRHLHTCVSNALRSEDVQRREQVIGEIMDVFTAKGR